MTTPTLSIIIPTHKRAEILAQCLGHIARQTIADELEVIVVSDGHDDATTAIFSNEEGSRDVRPARLSFFEIEKSHQGAARNRGVEHASAPLTLMIGDDMFLQPDACEKHVAAHRQWQESQGTDKLAVLGSVTWDPALDVTPVMRWLEASGWQFGYEQIAAHAHSLIPQATQERYTYTSQISLPTRWLKSHPFREDVSLYGWEDIEWGMRLKADGIPLFYEPDAKVHHHHPMTLEQSLERMRTLGRSAVHFGQLVPGFDRVPRGLKRWLYWLSSWLPTMAGKHRGAFLSGVKQGERAQ